MVAHTVCPKCIDHPVTPKAICKDCGSRCPNCNEEEGPCPGTCGFREVVFEGDDTAQTFGRWLFTVHHKYCKVIAHNMKGYDGYFLLEYLIDQSMRPDKIIYNGSKIMYMTVEKDLHIKVIDSLNFLPMKLAALPKVFGLTELKKGWFPFSSTPEIINTTSDLTLTSAITGVTSWEPKKEKNACPGSIPKRTPSSLLEKKCWNTVGVTWTFFAKPASSFETY